MRVFTITFLLSCAVLVFPRALQSGWIILWFVLVFLIISAILWSRKKDGDKHFNKKYNLQDNNANKVEKDTKVDEDALVEELSPPPDDSETQAESDAPLPLLEVGNSQKAEEIVEGLDLLTIDELIDMGFKEKHLGNFQQAAVCFSRALTLEPMPNLAFYLIIDYYWLLDNLEERDYALTELRVHIQKYLPQFNSELRRRFDAWLHKENLIKYFN